MTLLVWRNIARAVATAAVLAVAAGSALAGSPLRPYTDDDLARGFYSTVFGIEHGDRSAGGFVKKFHVPVRFSVEGGSDPDRIRQVAAFIRKLPKTVPGLDARLAGSSEAANFHVHVVDRASYADRVRKVAYGGSHGKVPGRCMVKVDFGPSGIVRADAFIVADEGERLFRRCMIEEILQGLGPMNDDDRLADSVFNDRSRHDALMGYDRAIVAMLYDRRVRHGMRAAEVGAVMPDLVAAARKRVR